MKLVYLAYGKNAEDVTKHLRHQLIIDDEELIEKCKSRYFMESKEINDENNEVVCSLVKQRKQTINDNKPCHIGNSILAWSKLLFYRYNRTFLHHGSMVP